MDYELLAVAAALGGALLPLLRAHPGRVARRIALCGWLAATLGLWAGAARYRAVAMPQRADDRPLEAPGAGYTTSDACRSCHPREHDSWSHSWHRTMTQEVTARSAIGDFSVGRLTHGGAWHYDLEREGDDYWVSFDEPALGGRVRRPIAFSTGSHHMQAYWISLADGARDLGLFPLFYLKEDARWVPRDSVFVQPERPGPPQLDPRRWNLRCLFCHSTGPRPHATPESVDTEATELGIACEACHGPGRAHVRANAGHPFRRYWQHWSGARDDTIVQPARLPKERAVEVCGQCHGILVPDSIEERIRSFATGYRYRPGDALAQSGRTVLRSGAHASDPDVARARATFTDIDLDASFWPDGMPRVPREYNALLETACFQRGEMTCQSCHEMHQPAGDPRPREAWADDQLALGMRGDAACLQCHERFASEVEAHTHHARESQGSRCQNCHMPYTTYALLKAIRQHQIDVPTTAASVATGCANACNACHLDESLGWTARHLEEWYGQPRPALDTEQEQVAAALLWMAAGDAAQRALAAWYAGWAPAREASGGDWLVPPLGQLLDDPYPAVRYLAWRSLRQAAEFGDLDYDYVGPAAQRAAARDEVWRRWHARPRPPGERARPLLLEESGALDRVRFAQLLSRRDDRPVFIAE